MGKIYITIEHAIRHYNNTSKPNREMLRFKKMRMNST
jgi:hypothetical protein